MTRVKDFYGYPEEENPLQFVITFTRRGWFSDVDDFRCDGELKLDKKCLGYKVNGKWNGKLTLVTPDTDKEGTVVWQRNAPVANHRVYYFMSFFTLQLNYLSDELKQVLPPTDSRRRPDQRALEEGNLRVASDMKNLLEVKQRQTRKLKDKLAQAHQCAYFEFKPCEFNDNSYWQYTEKYFEKDRLSLDWS